ncbi:hypothetical protein CEG14_09390 [Bordetella genomosp. 1]|uniref:DUF3540 domain-containing protein n=1 Tax=Bordetella genomosp. 1 TaxID=1395607 RepID=A0A261SD79_9BORD|nr:DUF3540 domain-containing protein [Bordetella genomosp. 1]OZI35306.1 hypothetical protein CEG14_09390 [Bordetella genomosp. 1]
MAQVHRVSPSPAVAPGGAGQPVHALGEVAMVVGPEYVVRTDTRQWRCRRAASCLLAPVPGDEVLVSGPDEDRVYIIAVTLQTDPSVARLQVEGELVLGARAGITLDSAAALRLQARERLELQAPVADCAVDTLSYRGKEARLTVGQVRLTGRIYELVVDKLVQMARNALRLTEETDQTRVGVLDMEARQTARLHGTYNVVTGEELVKVDGRQIHMG